MPTPNLQHLTAPAAPWVSVLFVATTLLTAALLVRLVRRAKAATAPWLVGIGLWLALQAALAGTGFYQQRLQQLPPRLALLGILPPTVGLAYVLLSQRGRAFISRLRLPGVTGLSIVRVPVEIVLYALVGEQLVPEVMTFAGRNFDIVAGLTAPVAAYAYARGWLGRRGLLVWHVAALGLLLNIVVLAVLAAPSPLQRLALEQPNVAVLQFPFAWLPAFVVPVVLLTHLAALRQLWGGGQGRGNRHSPLK